MIYLRCRRDWRRDARPIDATAETSKSPDIGAGTGVGDGEAISGKPPGFCDFIARGPSGDHAGEIGMQGLSGRQIMGLERLDLFGHALVRLHSTGRKGCDHTAFLLSEASLLNDGLDGLISACMAKRAVGATKSHSAIPFRMGFNRVDIANLVLSRFA